MDVYEKTFYQTPLSFPSVPGTPCVLARKRGSNQDDEFCETISYQFACILFPIWRISTDITLFLSLNDRRGHPMTVNKRSQQLARRLFYCIPWRNTTTAVLLQGDRQTGKTNNTDQHLDSDFQNQLEQRRCFGTVALASLRSYRIKRYVN